MPLTILVVDRALPLGTTQGNALIGHHLFRRLREHRLLLIAPDVPEGRTDHAAEDLAAVFDRVELVPRDRTPTSIGGWFANTGVAAGDARRWARTVHERIRSVVLTEDVDVVHVRQLPMAPFGAGSGSPARLLELVDSETLASRRHLPRSLRSRLRERVAATVERRAMAGFDVVTTVGSADAAVLRALAPKARVEVTPNGVDADYWKPSSLAVTAGSVVFTGAMSFPPNIAAARFLVDEVLPLVWSTEPTVHLTIAGRDPGPSVLAMRGPRVTVTGSVPDLRPYLAQAETVICPMVSGSGVKNKVLEGLAMGKPVLGTPLAIEGLTGLEPGRHVAIGASARQLADALLRLRRDASLREALGAAGRQIVLERYSWDACADRYDRLYHELASRRDDRRSAHER